MAILTVICDINAKMNNADSSTHFSLFRLAESVSDGLELQVDLLSQKLVGFLSLRYPTILWSL
jgi:hypothetical protein